jgi:hypothetical protein
MPAARLPLDAGDLFGPEVVGRIMGSKIFSGSTVWKVLH